MYFYVILNHIIYVYHKIDFIFECLVLLSRQALNAAFTYQTYLLTLTLVVLKTFFEYKTAECRLDWIDLLAFTAFHLSLEMEITTLQSSFVILMD